MHIKSFLIGCLMLRVIGFSQTTSGMRDSLFHLSLSGKCIPIFSSDASDEFLLKKNSRKFIPLVDLAGVYSEKTSFKSHLGGRFQWQGESLSLSMGALGGITNNQGALVPHWFEKPIINEVKASIMPALRLAYKPNPYVSAQLGFDRTFYGDGYRSLFLSDIGKPYPYASIRFKVGPISYQNMAAYLFAPTYLHKYQINHFLHWKITQNLQLNFFESVLFNSGDSTTNRTFDPYYLNPFVFIRPQEYANGSSDNVLMGIGASLSLRKAKLYSQLVVDDFLIASLSSGGNYWGNKWGVQLGWKHATSKNHWKIMSRIEGNLVRPYTYAHIGSSLNYTNDNMVLSHPLGGNFWELYESHMFIKGSLSFLVELSAGQKGYDLDTVSFGGDVFVPYTNRPSDYGVTLLQGNKTTFISSRVKLGLVGNKNNSIEGFLELNLRYSRTIDNSFFQLFPLLGIRSRVFNDYRF